MINYNVNSKSVSCATTSIIDDFTYKFQVKNINCPADLRAKFYEIKISATDNLSRLLLLSERYSFKKEGEDCLKFTQTFHNSIIDARSIIEELDNSNYNISKIKLLINNAKNSILKLDDLYYKHKNILRSEFSNDYNYSITAGAGSLAFATFTSICYLSLQYVKDPAKYINVKCPDIGIAPTEVGTSRKVNYYLGLYTGMVTSGVKLYIDLNYPALYIGMLVSGIGAVLSTAIFLPYALIHDTFLYSPYDKMKDIYYGDQVVISLLQKLEASTNYCNYKLCTMFGEIETKANYTLAKILSLSKKYSFKEEGEVYLEFTQAFNKSIIDARYLVTEIADNNYNISEIKSLINNAKNSTLTLKKLYDEYKDVVKPEFTSNYNFSIDVGAVSAVLVTSAYILSSYAKDHLAYIGKELLGASIGLTIVALPLALALDVLNNNPYTKINEIYNSNEMTVSLLGTLESSEYFNQG